jgi:hypothetical protein
MVDYLFKALSFCLIVFKVVVYVCIWPIFMCVSMTWFVIISRVVGSYYVVSCICIVIL